MIGGVWKGRDDHFLSLRPLSTRARKKGGGRWEGKAGRKFSRYTVYIEQATTFDEARRPTSARILAICAVHRPVPRQRVAQFTFRTYLATKRATDFYEHPPPILFAKFLSKDTFFIYKISFFILCLQARFLDHRFTHKNYGSFYPYFVQKIPFKKRRIPSFPYFVYRRDFSTCYSQDTTRKDTILFIFYL